jgi:hypothetical protein
MDDDEERAFSMIRTARIGAALAGLASFGAAPSAAHAGSDEPVQLSWTIPERSGCPDVAYVLEEIRRYVGIADRPPIVATATLRAEEGGGFQLLLTTVDGASTGERAFRDDSCRALADAAVVVLAWMVAPEAMASRPAPDQASRPPQARPLRTVAATASKPIAFGSTAYVGLDAAVDWGTLPVPALGVELRAGLWLKRLRLEARAEYWPAQRKEVAPLTSGEIPGATFTLLALGLEACLEAFNEPATSRFGLAFCTGPEIDRLNAVGFGVSVPAQGTKAWLSFSAGIEGRVAVTNRVNLFLNLASVLPSEREHFALRGVGEVHRPSPLAARAGLGFELEL